MITVREMATRKEIKQFIELPFQIYKDDPYFVPPLKSDLLSTLMGKNNGLFDNGPHKFYMAFEDGKPVARILTGCDNEFNKRKKLAQGYLSLFDSYNNYEAAKAVFDVAVAYQRIIGNNKLTGPNSPTFDDFGMGILVQGFDGQPMLFNVYNSPYYEELFLKYGFTKYMDHFAYDFNREIFDVEKYRPVVEYTQKRFDLRVEPCDISKDFDRIAIDAHRVFCEGMPDNDFNMPRPTLDEVYKEIHQLKQFYHKDFLLMAYVGDRPVGIVLAMPDYNQVLKHLNGKLFPFGIFKFFYYKKKINAIRVIIQFVVKEYQNRAVNGAMFFKLFESAKKHGILYAEGSTIEETNAASIASVTQAGGRLYRIYRQYQISI